MALLYLVLTTQPFFENTALLVRGFLQIEIFFKLRFSRAMHRFRMDIFTTALLAI
jgi:hypothetical protein